MTPQDVERVLPEIVRRLREALSPAAIYLFGSCAEGCPGPDSDIDLLVLVEDDPRHPYDRDAAAYLALAGMGVPKDVLVYTRREFEERAALPVSFERTVQQKGKVIYAAA
jgi:uncharacterized protein